MLNKFILILAAAVVCIALPVQAVEVSVAPMRSELFVELGQRAEQELIYTNSSSTKKTVNVFTKPFYLDGQSKLPLFERSGVAYTSEIEQAVSLSATQVVVDPGAQARVTLTAAPVGIPDGPYDLAVFFEEVADPTLVPGGTQVRTSLAALAHITVAPGVVAPVTSTPWYRSAWFALLIGAGIAFVLIDILYRVMRARKARSWERIIS